MPTDDKKKHQLEDILSDNVSFMDSEDLSLDASNIIDEEAKEGFCVECKDQEVRSITRTNCLSYINSKIG
jgi:hypothetical protein